MEKLLRLDEQDIIQVLADHFDVDRANVCLTIKTKRRDTALLSIGFQK